MNIAGAKKAIERDVSRMITRDFKKAADDIMGQFYDYYSPEYYTRTNALRKSVVPVWGNTYGGVNINIENHYKEYTMWDSGIRGLPPHNKGFVDLFYASIPDFGILSSTPDGAMEKLETIWETKRKSDVEAIVDKHMYSVDIFS